jgi:alkyldihydroxyacetonephosphate synthase
LRLHRAPQERTFSAYTFNDVASGSNALRRIFQNGLRPAVARLYDPLDSFLLRHGGGGGTVDWQKLGAVLRSAVRIPRALNAASEMFSRSAWGRCTLLLIFEGSGDEAAADSESAHALCLSEAGRPLGEAPARAWFQHRYAISYRQALLLRSGVFSDTLEVAAPWSKIERLYRDVRRALAENALVFAHLSHAYPDGSCIYFTFCGAGRNPADASAVHQRAWRQALGAALEAGGTISHHHGIGRSKATALVEELGEGAILTRRLMQVCDPDQIMNPGTLLPPGLPPELPPGAPAPEHPTSIPLDEPVIDSTSQLATIAGRSPLSKAEAWLQDRGFTLRLGAEAPLSASVASWIAGGVAGAPDRWSDPVDQRVAGLDGRLSSGHRVIIRPVPRRAVGPDLMALFVGAGGRIGSVESATLRVYRLREPEARPHPFHFPRNQPLGAEEASTWERIATTLSKA